MIVIDKLCYRSKLRYVNASVKVVYALVTLMLCVAGRSIPAAVVIFLVNGILTVGKGGIPLSRYLKLLQIPAAFLLVGTAAIIGNISREPMDAFAIPIGEWYLTCSRAGLWQAVTIGTTAFAAVSCLYFLSLNTTMTDILGVLRKLHVPALFVELMMLIYRFLFLLMETASAVMTAQECRLGGRDFRTRVRSFGEMGTAVFIRALRRSDAMYNAMESRCYDGTIRVLPEEHPARGWEIALTVCYELFLLGLIIINRF